MNRFGGQGALVVQRRPIYPDAVITLRQASGISYLIHMLGIATAVIMMLLFVVPPKQERQFTEIEFVSQQPEVQHVKKTKVLAEKNSINSGRHDPKKVVVPTQTAASAPAQATSRPAPLPVPTPVNRAPMSPSAPPPRIVPAVQPVANTAPAPISKPVQNAVPQPALPTMPRSTLIAANPVPLPLVPSTVGPAAPQPVPIKSSQSAQFSAPPSSAFAPTNKSTSTGVAGVTPVPIIGRNLPAPASASGAPSPTRIATAGTGSNGSNPGSLVTPVMGRPGTAHSDMSNQKPGARCCNPSDEGVQANFGAYMSELQRRIRRNWYPPKDGSSKRIVVTFKISANGDVSMLRIQTSSGTGICDQAALKAIEDSSPLPHLPPHAPPDVDIQFTFDYNVFGGSPSASFRRF
jgi:TonB family protein